MTVSDKPIEAKILADLHFNERQIEIYQKLSTIPDLKGINLILGRGSPHESELRVVRSGFGSPLRRLEALLGILHPDDTSPSEQYDRGVNMMPDERDLRLHVLHEESRAAHLRRVDPFRIEICPCVRRALQDGTHPGLFFLIAWTDVLRQGRRFGGFGHRSSLFRAEVRGYRGRIILS